MKGYRIMCDNKKEELKAKIDTIAVEIGKKGRMVAKKTIKMADAASTRIKLQSINTKLNAEYENLGRLSYNRLVKDRENTEKISASIERIEELRTEVETLKTELAEKLKAINEN